MGFATVGDISYLFKTWRIEKFERAHHPPNPQMDSVITAQVELMRGYHRITYYPDGSSEETYKNDTHKGEWDAVHDGKIIYATNEGAISKYIIVELSRDKFMYKLVTRDDTLIFTFVPFSAKDTLNRKPLPEKKPISDE